MTKKYFHYVTMPMHRLAMEPLFAELRARGWKEAAAGCHRDIAFVSCAEVIRPEYKEWSPIAWLPHGLSPAKWAYPAEFGQGGATLPDLLLLPGRFYAERLVHGCASYLCPEIPHRVVGWPKSDSLFDGSTQPVETSRPLILFAPSWNDENLTTVGTRPYTNQVKRILRGLGTLVVAQHPVYEERQKQGIAQLNEYLMAADVVITDQSSIGIEAALIDKPVVHLFELYKQRGWKHRDGETFVVGHMATLNTLRESVQDALANPSRYDFMRRYWREGMLSHPGDGARRAADAVEAFLDERVACNEGGQYGKKVHKVYEAGRSEHDLDGQGA